MNLSNARIYYIKEVSSVGKETLTPKQRLFCYEYVLDHNGKRSYQAAYPNCKAPGSAESQASRLLRNDKVKNLSLTWKNESWTSWISPQRMC